MMAYDVDVATHLPILTGDVMKFKIHFELPDGTEDSVILEGDELEEIRVQAMKEISKRNGKNYWSEEMTDR